ncbi:MAG TPA: LuxR C-terminal-related transcriptional regulator [Acidiferrobacter sp.]|nr:LuxR C-terminal-related transcriptional regulator [Acidiferrobacter sp.]
MWKSIQTTRASEDFGIVTPDILAQSYERCRDYEVSEYQERVRDTFGDGETKNLLQRNARLLAYGRLVVEEYMADLKGTSNLFILTQAEGRILGLWSHPEIVAAANDFGLVPGTSLGEGSAGTTAVALALATQGPVALSGNQHLCHFFHDWSCAAAPIVSSDGDLVGCLDISTSDGPIHERLALARSIARELGRLVGNKRRMSHGVTPRQREVLALFAQGLSYKAIGTQLSISIKTVEEHLDATRNKIGTKSRRACIKKAIELGIL